MSGAFAPVAFFWLAYSVLMQRQELRLQREELKETRDVLSQQKEEMKTSALATEKMAILQNKQVEIQIKIKNHQIFGYLLQNYKDYIQDFGAVGVKIENNHPIPVYFCIIHSDGRPVKFRTGIEIKSDIKYIIKTSREKGIVIDDENIERIRRILYLLRTMKLHIEGNEENSESYKIFCAMELQIALEAIEILIDYVEHERR